MNSLRSALTAAPASQIIPTIRGIRVTSKKRTCPDHRGNNQGNGVYTKSRTLPLSEQQWTAQDLYEKFYCARGEMENRIKEKMCLFADRLVNAIFLAEERDSLFPGPPL
jgi:hypothetical protein